MQNIRGSAPPEVPPRLQHANANCEAMSNIGVKQRCPLSPHTIQLVHWWTWNIFGRDWHGFYMLIEHGGCHSLLFWRCGFTFYIRSKPKKLNKLIEFCTSSSLEVKLAMTKIMIFDRNKKKINQKAFYLDKDQIEITHEYKYLGIDIWSYGYFEPCSKEGISAFVKALMGTLYKEAIVGVTC